MSLPIKPIIYNGVTQFVERIGQRKIWRWSELDMLHCTWTGPTSGALNFKPQVESRHPTYPLMFCTDSEITDQEAGYSEVQATYQGIIQTGGSIPYRTQPILAMTPVQGSRDFETQYSNMVSPGSTVTAPQLGVGQQVYPTYVYGTQKVNVRYMGTQVTLKYFHYPQPKGDVPFFSQEGLGLVTMKVISEYFGEVTAIGTYTGPAFNLYQLLPSIPQTSPPIRILFLGMSMEQKGLWYSVTEHYGPTF